MAFPPSGGGAEQQPETLYWGLFLLYWGRFLLYWGRFLLYWGRVLLYWERFLQAESLFSF